MDNRGRPVGRRRRGSLSAEEILVGADALIAADGLHALSMPRLARTLGCGVTSIYWYFRSKDELLVALAEHVARRMHTELAPIVEGPWEVKIVEYFAAFRDLMHRTPVYREVFAYRQQTLTAGSALARSVRARFDAGLAIFVDAGLDADTAAAAYFACANFTQGYLLLEHGFLAEDAARPDGGGRAALATELRALPPAGHPHLAATTDVGTILGVGDDAFRFGLRLLLDGLAAEHPGRRAP